MRFSFLLLISFICSLSLGAQLRESMERGDFSEEILYDARSRPLEITLSRVGKIEETQSYTYGSNRIQIRTAGKDDRGQEYIWNDTLYLRDDGSLRMMERKGTGEAPLLGWDTHSGWISHGDFSEIIIYNERGRQERRVLYKGAEPAEEELCHYDERGELTDCILENHVRKERWERDYFPGETMKEERLYRSDLLVSQTSYTYNEAGQPLERVTLGRGQTESWSGIYDTSGRLSEERYFKGGLLSRRIIHGKDEKTEEIYSRGRLSLKIHYQNGEIIDEETFD